MALYFVSAESIPTVKIGHAIDPLARLAGLGTSSPVPLKLVACDMAGDMLTERELQWRFRHLQSHHEWFVLTAELRACIEATARTGAVPGGWYLPPAYPYKSNHSGRPSGMRLSDLKARFRLTGRKLSEIVGLSGASALQAGQQLPLSYIPSLVAHFQALDHDVTHFDFLDRAAIPANDQAAA